MVNEHIRSIIGILIMLVILYVFYWTGPPWNTSQGAVVIYSVLAFLFVTLTASLDQILRVDDNLANRFFIAVTGYSALIFSGAAVFYTFQPQSLAIQSQTSGIFLNLVAFASAGLLVLLFSLITKMETLEALSPRIYRITGPLLVLILTIIFGYCMIIARSPFPISFFLIGGYIVGGVAIFSFSTAAIIMYSQRDKITIYDPLRLSFSFVLNGAAAVVLVLILPNPSQLWLISMGFMVMGLVYLAVGLVYPYLLNIGVQKKSAYLFSLTVIVLIIAPFLAGYIVDKLVIDHQFIDVGFVMFNHIGASALAGGAAFILYSRSEKKPAPWRFPIISLFLYWSVAEFSVGLSSLLIEPFNGTGVFMPYITGVVPYIIGAAVSTILIALAYVRTLSPKQNILLHPSRRIYVLVIFASVLLLLGSEIVRLDITQLIPDTLKAPLWSSLMLLLSYSSLFVLLNLFFVLMGISGGHFTVDTNIAGLSTIWLILIILRANFESWTAGWWMGELVLFVAELTSIVYLVITYVQITEERSKLEDWITIQKNIFSPELLLKIRDATTILEELAIENNVDRRFDLVSKSLSNLSRAEDIVHYMNICLSDEAIKPSELTAIDLLECLRSVITPEVYGCTLTFEDVDTDCIVLANNLILDALRNIFDVIVIRIGKIDTLTVSAYETQGGLSCILVLTMRIHVKNAYEKQDLLQRYITSPIHETVDIKYSKRITLLFGGTLKTQIRVPEVDLLEVHIQISLPKK